METLRKVWGVTCGVLAVPVFIAGWFACLVAGGFFIYALTLVFQVAFLLVTGGSEGLR